MYSTIAVRYAGTARKSERRSGEFPLMLSSKLGFQTRTRARRTVRTLIKQGHVRRSCSSVLSPPLVCCFVAPICLFAVVSADAFSSAGRASFASTGGEERVGGVEVKRDDAFLEHHHRR